MNDRIELLKPQVAQVARVMTARLNGVTYDELYVDGLYGAWQAIRSYDPSRGASLATYAAIRIRGAILDGVRGRDVLTRTTRRKGLVVYVDPVWLERQPAPFDFSHVDDADAFDGLVAHAPEPDRELLVMHYRDGLPKKDLATHCGYTAGWISRTLPEILDNLRTKLEGRAA